MINRLHLLKTFDLLPNLVRTRSLTTSSVNYTRKNLLSSALSNRTLVPSQHIPTSSVHTTTQFRLRKAPSNKFIYRLHSSIPLSKQQQPPQEQEKEQLIKQIPEREHHSCGNETRTNTIEDTTPSNYIEGRYLIGFGCKVCDTQNYKFMSKHAYTKGVVIIRCDGCSNLHLIADHLGWFDSQNPPGTIEDIMKQNGKPDEVKRLTMTEEQLATLPKEMIAGLVEYLPKN